MFEKVIVVGNLGNDPEMRYMADGTAVTNFSIATNRQWTDQATGEGREQTTWYRVSVWGRQAEACNEYLEKGRTALVEGRMNADPDTGGPRLFTRQDGTVGSSYELRAFNVRFLGGGNGNGKKDDDYGHAGTPVSEEDEIPF